MGPQRLSLIWMCAPSCLPPVLSESPGPRRYVLQHVSFICATGSGPLCFRRRLPLPPSLGGAACPARISFKNRRARPRAPRRTNGDNLRPRLSGKRAFLELSSRKAVEIVFGTIPSPPIAADGTPSRSRTEIKYFRAGPCKTAALMATGADVLFQSSVYSCRVLNFHWMWPPGLVQCHGHCSQLLMLQKGSGAHP